MPMALSAGKNKGTVTQLSEIYPVEEAQKASILVQETISERHQQLNQLKGFINDNVELINLVQRLPDEMSHHVMVPFGKAAFFPGRLIHTNEFMVLLGEGYFAERTSKQTIEILRRRGKALDTQVESVKAIIKDLKAESSFFDTTANESVEGLVDIREDYDEECSDEQLVKTGYEKPVTTAISKENNEKALAEDEEYERIFKRIAELEKEEEEEEEEEKANEADEDQELDNKAEASGVLSSFEDLDVSLHEKPPSANNNNSTKNLEVPQVKDRVQAPGTASGMAFTGSIIEHAPNFGTNFAAQQTSAPTSKPVSRFRSQRK